MPSLYWIWQFCQKLHVAHFGYFQLGILAFILKQAMKYYRINFICIKEYWYYKYFQVYCDFCTELDYVTLEYDIFD